MGEQQSGGLLTVVYTGEPDDVFELISEEDSITFGRDDEKCDLVVWSAINGRDLSRVAGRIWRMDGELWIRNLATSHELQLQAPGRPPEAPLPPRKPDGFDRGPARTIPGPICYVRAPGECELLVRQEKQPVPATDLSGPSPEYPATLVAPPVPGKLLDVAIALCEPLLLGGTVPAPYNRVKGRLNLSSYKRARVLVDELVAFYSLEVPTLRERFEQRRRRQSDGLAATGGTVLRGGVHVFRENTAEGPGTTELQPPAPLPASYDVAHFLVRRDLVTHADLRRLPPL